MVLPAGPGLALARIPPGTGLLLRPVRAAVSNRQDPDETGTPAAMTTGASRPSRMEDRIGSSAAPRRAGGPRDPVVIRVPLFAGLEMNSPPMLADACGATLFPRRPAVRRRRAGRPFLRCPRRLGTAYRQTADGRESLIALFAAGRSPRRSCSSAASFRSVAPVEESRLLVIPAEPFRRALRSNNELCFKMMASMAIHLRHLVVQVEQLTVHVHGADRQFLLELARSGAESASHLPYDKLLAARPRHAARDALAALLAAAARRRDQRQPGHNSRHRCPAAPLHGTAV